MTSEYLGETQYINLVKDVLETGKEKKDRTNTGTISKFGCMMRFSLKDNKLPLLTTKEMAVKSILEELLFFVRGQTDNEVLLKKKCNIWTANSTKSFLKEQGINRREGDLGPVYGFQWRHFGAEYKTCEDDYSNQGFDQLNEVIEAIKKNPDSRRHVVISWNPKQLKEMVLPPCHLLFQFYVQDGYLSCSLYQRSGDMGLGIPFNIASYSFLIYMVAYLTDLKPGEFVHFIGDTHVYSNHVDSLKEQIQRKPFEFPNLFLRPKREIKRIEDFEVEDFEIVNYESHPKIFMRMAI